MITATSGLFPLFSGILFSLVQREPSLAIKCIKTFSLDEIVTRVGDPTEERNHLRMRDLAAVRLGQKPTAPVVRTKRFRVTTRPHLHTTITDHREFYSVTVNSTERIAEIVCRTFGPIEKNVNADHLFVRRLFRTRGARMRLVALAILPRRQDLWRLAQPLDHGIRKLLCPNFLLADFVVVNVVGVNTVLDRAQPRIVNTFGMVS